MPAIEQKIIIYILPHPNKKLPTGEKKPRANAVKAAGQYLLLTQKSTKAGLAPSLCSKAKGRQKEMIQEVLDPFLS